MRELEEVVCALQPDRQKMVYYVHWYLYGSGTWGLGWSRHYSTMMGAICPRVYHRVSPDCVLSFNLFLHFVGISNRWSLANQPYPYRLYPQEQSDLQLWCSCSHSQVPVLVDTFQVASKSLEPSMGSVGPMQIRSWPICHLK